MKNTIANLVLLLIAVCAFAQAPDWQWASQAGGSGNDHSKGIALDENGNCYVVGYFDSTMTFDTYSLTSSGDYDIFVAKMDANGNWLWAAKAGGSGSDYGYEIAIDDNGNSYVTGWFEGTATFGTYSLTSSGSTDIFVARIDADGNWLWATKTGGSSHDYSFGIAVDDNSNCYVTGSFYGPATFGSYTINSSGARDIFVAKIDANSNWQWASQAGGSGMDIGQAIAIDDNGNSYVTGSFYGTVTFGTYSLTSSGGTDIFVARLDADGNWLWATQAGGSNLNISTEIAIDDNGNCYVVGYFDSTVTFGTYSLTSSEAFDIFVAKIDANGNWLWAVKAGGNSDDMGIAIASDINGNSYITGYFASTVTFGTYSLTSSGAFDIFVAKIDANGNWLWATQAGGDNFDSGSAIAINDNGDNYMTGNFYSTATFGSYTLNSSGSSDIFVTKLNSNTSIEDCTISTQYDLSNYPNPFNPTTTISYNLTTESNIELSIYNIKGQKIKQLVKDQLSAGKHTVNWNGTDQKNQPVSSGIYLYKLNADGRYTTTKKMILLK